MPIDSSKLLPLMATLAGEANKSAVNTLGPNYPNGWSTLAYIKGASSPPSSPAVQGFLAYGYADPQDPSSEMIAALALGIDWSNFFTNYQFQDLPPNTLDARISRSADSNLLIDDLYNSAYLYVRSAIWKSIEQFLGSYPLYICGMGLAGPLAQLAALDLRPSDKQQGPNNQFPPLVQPQCFVFSTPNVANSNLVTFYNQQVHTADGAPATSTYWAGKPGLTVDFFPTAPNDANAGILGNPMSTPSVTLPPVDVPWLERGNVYYIQKTGGAPIKGPNIPGSMVNVPTGFSQVLAYTLALINAEAYHQAQHPDSSGTGVPNYRLTEIVHYNNQPWAFIFTSAGSVVVAVRSAISWQEEHLISANSAMMNGSIVRGSSIHTGVGTFYGDSGGSAFRGDLLAAIQTAMKGNTKQLYLTGHSLGAAIVNLAAVDYGLNPNVGFQVAGIYNFGGIGLGDIVFKAAFDTLFTGKSYQINRLYDKVVTGFFNANTNFSPVDRPVILNGILPAEEYTYHALDSYIQLLNPGV